MRSNFAFRIRLIAVIVVAVALVLVARLYFVQVVHGEEYRQKAESQYAKQSTNHLDRGSIFFTAKDGSLISAATLASGYTVALNPTLIDDPEFTYTALKTLLPDIEHDPFIAKASKQGDTYEEIARKVSDNIGAKIKTLSMPGVELLRERWRFYPGNALAAHAIGFLGYGADGTTVAGRYGLERFYDDALRRNAGGLYVNFFADLFTNIGSQIFSSVTPETTYNDKGYAIYDGGRIANFDKKGRGVIPMQEVINQSLNTGAAFVVEKMGTEIFREYFEKFGVMEETGIDLPNEVAPLVENLKSPRTLEYATASFGQGIALTPVGMARALAALANHGVVPGPHVGVELRYGGGINKELGWSPERRAITAESADTINRMPVTAADTWLLGGTAKIPEYSIAAKTGTAEIARADARGYYDDRYLHSFFGYFPAYDPKFFIFLFAVEPTGARYASDTWTHPFMKTVRFLITYYDIPPDRAPRAP